MAESLRIAAVLATLLLAGAAPVSAQETPPEAATSETVEVTVDDAAITERLEGIYSQVAGLENVSVLTRSGVVTLEGEVLTRDARDNAEALARRIAGVVDVENYIEESQDVSEQLERASSQLVERLLEIARLLPLLAIAGVVFVLFWLVAAWAGRREALYRRLAPNPFLAELLGQAVRLGVIVIGLIAALEVIDATSLIGSVLGALGLAGLALGFALKDTVENYVASILLSLRQPFAPNDHVIIDGHEGRVIRLTPRATLLMTMEGNHVRIPNATVFKGTIVNFTSNDKRRFDFAAGIDPAADLKGAMEVAMRALSDTPGVLGDPGPAVHIKELGDSTINVVFMGWVDQRKADLVKVRTEAIRRLVACFDAAGIAMPEPTFNLRTEAVGPEAQERAPRPVAEAAGTEAPVDVSPDDAIDRQVREDLASSEQNLLDPQAPRE